MGISIKIRNFPNALGFQQLPCVHKNNKTFHPYYLTRNSMRAIK